MGAIQLQPRPLYGIGTVARLTGVKPDTLRIWERRYQLGASHKSASGRRQYTQADLEHLQLVSALVGSGTRIGEIAGLERRTLEALLRYRAPEESDVVVPTKLRVVFVGEELCDWLEEHQGCLVHIHAMLARGTLEDFLAGPCGEAGAVDQLVVECRELTGATLKNLRAAVAALGNPELMVLHHGHVAGQRVDLADWGAENRGEVAGFPPEPGFLAFHLKRAEAEKVASEGSRSLADLVSVKARLFDEGELVAAGAMQDKLGCDCAQQLPELVRALAGFEDCSASNAVDSWEDASVHACVYAYAGQARWLLEKALNLVVDAQRDREGAKQPEAQPLRKSGGF